ncbi:hypothetical protein CFC21_086225 [Triticum aestivum]|uniref:NB-ARC domain-containing protein n=2 Tax=Triticum aestivum TaxID=4565 RepID=A0A9R1IEN7_WHEAT|nr:uncharacterized protein LOC123135569 [Triticum aestivum]KAF7082350.1 hypothetical protein CFC21_086225 [Triticum aestivum]
MPTPEEIKIQAKTIDAAAEEIIGILEDTSKGNVIFVSGWHGFGASAALKVVAQRLKSSKSKFDRVIHVDCSLWKSMRALQKAIAEELELPLSVMAIFDWWDEEDDFNLIDEGSRGVIADISTEIFRKLANSRFVVIFHNGSDKYIDLYECGVPVIPILNNRVLWTWHGRFRPSFSSRTRIWREGNMEVSNMRLHTDVVVDYSHDDCIRDEALLEEAKEVVTYLGIPEPYMNHMIVEKCFQYAYALGSARLPNRGNWGYWERNWGNHASNYLVCDGIIQGQGDTSAWGVADALQRNVHLDWLLDSRESASDGIRRHLQLQCRLRDRWVLVVHKRDKGLPPDEIGMLLSEATSFFALPYSKRHSPITTLPDGIFQHSHSSKLRVLHLCYCRFGFESPPFLCCSQLRFLLLDTCSSIACDKHPIHNEDMSCFQKLWVLHLSYTRWYRLLSEEMMNFMADLRELYVEGDWGINDLRGRGPSLVKVHVESWNYFINHAPFPDLSSASFLKTIILDNCFELEQVVPGVLPPSLESFTFKTRSYGTNTSSISFRGCSQLKSILLVGKMERLEELDLSGTIVKTLDLREVIAQNLKRLILLGCEKLCAILWPSEYIMTKVLEVLHINTIRSTSPGQANWEEKPRDPIAAMGSSSILVATATDLGISPHAPFEVKWYISATDTRILRSLEPIKRYIEQSHVYMEMGSSPTSGATAGDSEVAQGIRSLCQPDNYLYARDAFFQRDLQAGADNEGAISWMWACPATPTPRAQDWYVHIQDKPEVKRGLLQQKQSNTEGINVGAVFPGFIVNNARMLHVHDSSSITCITCPQPQGSCWRWLEWCRVERCPKLRTVFYTPQPSKGDSFCYELATFWASELPKACYICDWNAIRMFSFAHIVLLHLDHCPRLIHVLPLSDSLDTLPHMDTLEIVCCGDLKEVFALDPKKKRQRIIGCPKLRRIHLYELPSLQHICGSRISAPNLETVKIRGCWSLRSLPAVSGNREKLPSVDCEKDWWDNLEWDGVEANHHPSFYDHNHSSHYKAQQQRGTVLR